MAIDLISRQAALDALPKKQKGIGGESWMKTYRRSGYNDCVEDCMKAWQALPSVQPGWIPCSRELPKKDGDYLVTTHSGQIARYIFIGCSSEEYWRRCATAWMPLPEPYKGES